MPGSQRPPLPPQSRAERLALVTAIIEQLPEPLVRDRTGKAPREFALRVLADALENPNALPSFKHGS